MTFKKQHIPWNKGKQMSLKQRAKLKKSWDYEKHITIQFREKLSKSISNKWLDPEYRNKRMKWLLNNPPNKGLIMPQEIRDKISKSKRGIPNLKLKGIPRTKEVIDKIKIARARQIFLYKNSKPERMMQIALALNNINFETQKPLPGQPDIFIEPNICVFIDGEYWHADPRIYNPEDIMKKGYKAKEIWSKDSIFNHKLNSMGYHVIRIWEKEIKIDANNCAENIIKLIQQLRGKIII